MVSSDVSETDVRTAATTAPLATNHPAHRAWSSSRPAFLSSTQLPDGLVLKGSGARLLYRVEADGARGDLLAVVRANGTILSDMPRDAVRSALAARREEPEYDGPGMRAAY